MTALTDVVAGALFDMLMEIIAETVLMDDVKKPLFVPIPLSSQRLKERGYNQSACIVDALTCHIKEAENGNGVLVKIRETSSQMMTQTKSERLENLKRAFTVPNAARVIGRTIIVVDDVTTTGATFTEARRALTEAGASKVICCAVAH
jgi:competence protein ComFC